MSDPGPRGRGDPVARSGGPGRGIAVAQARAIAGRAHRGQIEPSGRPFLAHVRRVARAVPPFARGVAWLHDVLEWTGMLEEDLVAAGLSPHERAALRLLTRAAGVDDGSFLSHVGVIALSPGPAGDLARAVKRADMEDRLRLPRDPAAAWIPPYRRGLGILARGGADREPDWAARGGGEPGSGSQTRQSMRGGSLNQIAPGGGFAWIPRGGGSLGDLRAARGLKGRDAALASSPDAEKGVST